MEDSVASIANDEVRPYRIRVSSRYLDLTRRKLELTRLPHEILLPKTIEWDQGTPKSEIEPLIDYWLESYDWRAQETHLNTTPQFRITIRLPLPAAENLRIHFIHLRSPKSGATPILLLPTLPLTNLSLLPLLTDLSHTSNYHIVAPSFPGLGFSDAFTSPETLPLEATAKALNELMIRLDYEHYMVSMTGAGRASPPSFYLARILAQEYRDNCLGAHLIDPISLKPTWGSSPWQIIKFTVAKFFHASAFGYDKNDFLALQSANSMQKAAPLTAVGLSGLGAGLGGPNTLAYALCDSPTGVLSVMLSYLHSSSKRVWEHEDIVTMAQLAWLPGPEAGLRYWWGAGKEIAEIKPALKNRGHLGVSVFLGEEDYTPPAWIEWGNSLWVGKWAGKAGVTACERVEEVVKGIEGLRKELLKLDSKLAVRELEGVTVEPVPEEDIEVIQMDVESPDTLVG